MVTVGRGEGAVLTAGSAPSRSVRKRDSDRACCSCSTACTGRSRSTPCTSSACPWCRASYSCRRWCWSDAHLKGQHRWGQEVQHRASLRSNTTSVLLWLLTRTKKDWATNSLTKISPDPLAPHIVPSLLTHSISCRAKLLRPKKMWL